MVPEEPMFLRNRRRKERLTHAPHAAIWTFSSHNLYLEGLAHLVIAKLRFSHTQKKLAVAAGA